MEKFTSTKIVPLATTFQTSVQTDKVNYSPIHNYNRRFSNNKMIVKGIRNTIMNMQNMSNMQNSTNGFSSGKSQINKIGASSSTSIVADLDLPNIFNVNNINSVPSMSTKQIANNEVVDLVSDLELRHIYEERRKIIKRNNVSLNTLLTVF